MIAATTRRSGVLTCLAISVLVVACFGRNDEATDEDDYIPSVAAAMAAMNARIAEAACEGLQAEDCDRSAAKDAYEAFVDDWRDIEPPVGLELRHEALTESLEAAREALAVPTEEIVERAEEFEVAALIDQRWEAWTAAVRDRFKVGLWTVETASMTPAFENGDLLLFPTYDGEPIQRWDLLVFRFHLDEERSFIKRVVGLPGETVEVREGGRVFIDGSEAIGDSYAVDPANYTYVPKTVPAGHYFVLGDNRRNSFDSHAWGSSCSPEQECDFVPAELIDGVLPADARPYEVEE